MKTEDLLKAILSGMAGIVMGWGANALTLGGRVTAIEVSLSDIKAALVTIQRQGSQGSKP
jgi:hypothetical protein